MTNTQSKTARLAKMAMLVAISIVLVAIVRFPIFPAVAFLEYDPAPKLSSPKAPTSIPAPSSP